MGIEKADLDVQPHNDDAMLTIMIAENANQQNDNVASALDAVAAAAKQLTRYWLGVDEDADDITVPSGVPEGTVIDPKKIKSIRGHIESVPLVTGYFATGPGSRTIQRHLDIADCDIKA